MNKIYMAIVLLFGVLMLGCNGKEIENQQDHCVVGDPKGKSLRFTTFEYEDIKVGPHVGGRQHSAAVVFVDKIKDEQKVIIGGYVQAEFMEHLPYYCQESMVDGETVLLAPIFNGMYVNTGVVDYGPEIRGYSKLVISRDGGETFKALFIPDAGPPRLAKPDMSHDSLSWYLRSLSLQATEWRVSQVGFHRQAIMDMGYEFEIVNSYLYGLKSRSGCDNCESVMSRDIVSFDEGESWRVDRWEITRQEYIDSLKDVSVYGSGYCVETATWKVELIDPNWVHPKGWKLSQCISRNPIR